MAEIPEIAYIREPLNIMLDNKGYLSQKGWEPLIYIVLHIGFIQFINVRKEKRNIIKSTWLH